MFHGNLGGIQGRLMRFQGSRRFQGDSRGFMAISGSFRGVEGFQECFGSYPGDFGSVSEFSRDYRGVKGCSSGFQGVS